jgi:hypothetical protein
MSTFLIMVVPPNYIIGKKAEPNKESIPVPSLAQRKPPFPLAAEARRIDWRVFGR